MADRARKNLVWEIRKGLLSLSPEELFQIANGVGPVLDEDPSQLDSEDVNGCFDHIHEFMHSKRLLESEDTGMVELLLLKDAIDKVMESHSNVTLPVDSHAREEPELIDLASGGVSQPDTANVTGLVSVTSDDNSQLHTASGIATTANSVNVMPDDIQKMLESYEDLSKKLRQFMSVPTSHPTSQPTLQSVPTSQPTLQHPPPSNNNTPFLLMPTSHPPPQPAPVQHIPLNNPPFIPMPTSHLTSKPTPLQLPPQNPDTPHHTHEKMVSLRDLSYLHRREFKVQGGQIGDHSSDISYTSVCRQIDEGLKENFGDLEIVRGVLRIIKPGDFKDMLMNKEDMTVAELKGFLQSHLGEKSSTELFQELMCAKQNEHETPQQFLYRVIGLKQRILFTSRQAETEIKCSPETVQGVFLHTVYQGIGHKHNDIRRELKPLLSDSTVTDETILKHVMKITSDESERRRRLGSLPRQKQTAAHSAQMEVEPAKESNPKKETGDRKTKTDNVLQLTERIDVLTKLVDSLAATVEKDRACRCSSPKPQAGRKERQYGCPKCLEKGLQDCKHCFYCGEEGHRAVGCLKKPKRQGNESRLLKRDSQ
ncbi:uncharacterized protein LOC133633945 [Entelurus aequoreus]|uniref:uncharacterized protein LOC133633945 n=1 Tax=Entelurus aequoreus TaxID=161455 RepID=UPI002B1D6689|nr:uncharacterized protein LOC133633945 [Entelurus aequoreus]